MAQPDPHQHPRTVGRYLLYGELASGGMATVHFGRLSGAVGFSRTVAIKRLHAHYAKDPDFVRMFLDEARLCGRIRHPNVVPTLDVVALENEIFIVMEYVAGEALSKLMKGSWQRNLPIPPRVAATIVSSVLHGLHAAHEAKDEHGEILGIVHRDVSPQNILVGTDGTSRVLDFGVAKAAGRLQTTRDGQVKGKIAYMPPEQLSGGSISRQSDIYAASVVLWEALCGRRLFDGETEALVLVRALEGKVPPPSLIRPDISSAIDAVVLRGLARDPAMRFGTAREMALAIEQVIGLASPYEVGDWVERIASDEIASRAQTIADIESAATASAPRIRLGSAPEVPHSQVSSISVSGPSVSPARVQRRSGGARVLRGVVAVLAVAGLTLGGLAVRDEVSRDARPARVVAARALSHERPVFFLVGPMGALSKASPLTVATGPRVGVMAPHWPPPPAPPPRANPCDPPYTIDPDTRHKKYKVECLK